MKIKKIVDTIENFGRAERYIYLSDNFLKFISRSFSKSELLKVDAESLVKKFNLKGIVFGNFVTQEERFFFILKIGKQLELLAKLKGSNNLGNGNLIIAFGAEGIAKSLAHFNPQKLLINLNRGRKGDYKSVLQGETSFVHEYGHYIDFLQGQKDKTINKNFASEAMYKIQKNEVTELFTEVTETIFAQHSYIQYLKKQRNGKYLMKPIEVFARIFESAINQYVADKEKTFVKYFDPSKYGNRRYIDPTLTLELSLDKKVIQCLKRT